MGGVSIIARRLSPNYVQYGWSGNGGYFRIVGARLLEWYDDPSLMDYLFGLGQLELIGMPGSENGGQLMLLSHHPTGEQHWVDPSERWIFSKIVFIDYGYFYDSDNTWYYVVPGPFRIKIPLRYIATHLDEKGYEFEGVDYVRKQAMTYFLKEYIPSDKELKMIADSYERPYDEIVKQVLESEYPDHEIVEHYSRLHKAMDDWIVVKTDEEYENITRIIMKKDQGEDNRIETIEWE